MGWATANSYLFIYYYFSSSILVVKNLESMRSLIILVKLPLRILKNKPTLKGKVRESLFNMTRGGMNILKLEAWNFSNPPSPSLAAHIFRSPPLLLVLKHTNFQTPPFRCLKIFGGPPPQYLQAPLVILNESSYKPSGPWDCSLLRFL